MSQSQDYGFCPNCGAVSKNGVCSSCGYKSKGARFAKPSDNAPRPVQTVYDYTKTDYTEPARVNSSFAGNKGNASKGYIGLAIASVAAIIIFVAAFFVFHTVKFGTEKPPKGNPLESARGSYSSAVSVSEVPESELNIMDEDYYDVFALKIYYNIDSFDVPEETAYAEENGYDYQDEADYFIYDDFIRTDLNYKIVNKTWKYNGYYADEYGDGYPDKALLRCEYPFIESDSLSFVDTVNDTILDLTTYMCDYYDVMVDYLADNEVYYGEEYVYVTYMSEDVMSLLLTYGGYIYDEDDDEKEPELVISTAKTVNFDMKTGEIMGMPELSMSEDAFLDKILEDINGQNEIDFLTMASMDELKEAYESGDLQWFFNPLGVEFMYVFPDLYGYFSCTENPDEFFVK